MRAAAAARRDPHRDRVAARHLAKPLGARAVSDKVYADEPRARGYPEDARLGGADPYAGSKAAAPEHETAVLAVDSARARAELGWEPRWDTTTAIDAAAAWYHDFLGGAAVERLVARDLDAYAV